MGKVVSLRLKDDQVERLERAARRMGRPLSTAALVLLEEVLRETDFPYVEFRDSVVGRQAYVQGSRLTVWQVKWLAQAYNGDASKVAEHVAMPEFMIADAMRYAEAYHEEIDAAIADNERTPEDLKSLIPNLEVFTVDATAP